MHLNAAHEPQGSRVEVVGTVNFAYGFTGHALARHSTFMSTTPAKGSNNLQAVVAGGAHHASFSTEFVNDVFRFASRYVVPLGFGQHIEQGCGGAGFV